MAQLSKHVGAGVDMPLGASGQSKAVACSLSHGLLASRARVAAMPWRLADILWPSFLLWPSVSIEVHEFWTNADPEDLFPDHDCVRNGVLARPRGIPWSSWLFALEDQGRVDSLLDRSVPMLSLLAGEEERERAATECPVGLLMVDILHALACYRHEGPDNGCYTAHDQLARKRLADLGFRVLIGTRWPIYDILNSDAWDAHPQGDGVAAAIADATALGLDCVDVVIPILDWQRFRRVFESPDWYQSAVDVAYGPELEKGWRTAATECPLGFAVANLIKAMLCAHTESICFKAHATMINHALSDTPLHLVAGSGWPIFRLLGHVSRVVRRHGFHLDFAPQELIDPTARMTGTSTAESAAMRDLRAELPRLRTAASEIVLGMDSDSVVGDDKSEPGSGLVYATMSYGLRFNPYVGRFISRARALGISDALVVFCLDADAYAACRDAEGHCVRGTPSILNKFTLPLMLLQHGLDVMWLDLDVFLFQAPTRYVEKQSRAGHFELLVSGSFAVDCVCSGVVLFKASKQTRSWLLQLLSWMYEHPYEHDQKAFSAFLRAGERVAFEHELPIAPESVPMWAFLDPETEFVSARHVDVAGWTGNPDRIVAFHLLHGDSDDAHASRQFAARFGLGVGYTPLLDTFFNQTELPELYNTSVLPHHVSPVLKEALWRSRWPSPRPSTPGRCNETVPMRY